MTVLCLAELEPDGGTVTDASLRALAFSRSLAEAAGEEVAAAVLGLSPAGPDDGNPLAEAAGAMLAAAGVSAVYVADLGSAGGYAPLAWARALAELAGSLLWKPEQLSVVSNFGWTHTVRADVIGRFVLFTELIDFL